MSLNLTIQRRFALQLLAAAFATGGLCNLYAAGSDQALALANAYQGRSLEPVKPSNSGGRISANELQVGRYTTVSSQPDESDAYPLAVTAKVHFPRGYVATVGDAVKYLLIRTGYELAPIHTMDEHVRRVFGLRLPESHRVMGPFRVEAMLQALLGRAFELKVDQSQRLVAYRALAASNPDAPVAIVPQSLPPAPTDTGRSQLQEGTQMGPLTQAGFHRPQQQPSAD